VADFQDLDVTVMPDCYRDTLLGIAAADCGLHDEIISDTFNTDMHQGHVILIV
jgi:hypothetical protein